MRALATRMASAVHHIVRAERRLPALFRARIEVEGQAPLCVSLRNVSRSGFMALTPDRLPAGSKVRLLLPFGDAVEAEIRWSFKGRAGCRLAVPFRPNQLVLLMLMSARGTLFSEAGARAAALLAAVAVLIFQG